MEDLSVLLKENGITPVHDSIELIRQLAPIKNKKKLDIILIVISRIKSGDDKFNEYTFDIKELVEIYNKANPSAENSRKSIEETIDNLMNIKNVFIDKDGKTIKFIWFPTATISEDKTTVTLEINKVLSKYLLQTDNIVVYQLEQILKLGFKSAMLYRWAYTYKDYYKKYSKEVEIEMSKLQDMFVMNKDYPARVFNDKYLNPAIKEINDLTDLNISYRTKRKSKTNPETKIVFTITCDYEKPIPKPQKTLTPTQREANKERSKAMWQENLQMKRKIAELEAQLAKSKEKEVV